MNRKSLIINTDGGARGNPGPAGTGVVIKSQSGETIYRHSGFIGEATNNVAEYRALIKALEEAFNLGGTHLAINMDSELIVRQMQGKYKIKEPALQELAAKVFALQNKFQNITFSHIPREKNKEADALVNEALDKAR